MRSGRMFRRVAISVVTLSLVGGAFYAGALWERARSPSLDHVLERLAPEYGVSLALDVDRDLAATELMMAWERRDPQRTHVLGGWELHVEQGGEEDKNTLVLARGSYNLVGSGHAATYELRLSARPVGLLPRLRSAIVGIPGDR